MNGDRPPICESEHPGSQATAIVPRPDPSPLALIQLAVERGLDPEQLGKLLDLQERVDRARAVEAFNAAMNAAQQEMPTVLHDAENTHTRKRYARLEAVNTTIKPIYGKHGFSISFGTGDSPLPAHVRVLAKVRHAAGHHEEYQADIPLDGKGAKGGDSSMNACQAQGSTYSYGQRYLLKMIFNLTIAGEDQDGNTLFLTGDQIKEINDLVEECGKLSKPIDFARFLKWLGVETLAEAGPAHFAKAIHELNARRRKAQQENER